MAVVIGIDPGSTSGIAIFDTDTREIVMAEIYQAIQKDYDKKIKWLSDGFAETFEPPDGVVADLICIETFVMRGKGGQQLQKLIGGYVARVPEPTPIAHVYNTTVKRLVGGKGNNDKEQVANGVLKFFESNRESKRKLLKIIGKEQWDLTDAFAIGIAGWMEYKKDE